MKIILIGSNGFLGANIKARFSRKHQVKTLSFRPEQKAEFTLKFKKLLLSYQPEVVINVGASQNMEDGVDDIAELIDSNILLPNILASQIQNYSSNTSLITFGTSWERSQNEYSPFNAYAASKSACVRLLEHFALNGVKICNLKLFDVYGPNDDRNKVLNLISGAINENKCINMSGGKQVINLVHIKDVLNAIEVAIQLTMNKNHSSVLNYSIGGEEPLLLKEVGSLMCKIAGVNIDNIISFGYYPYRTRERFEIEPFNPVPGWKCKITLRKGLAELIQPTSKF